MAAWAHAGMPSAGISSVRNPIHYAATQHFPDGGIPPVLYQLYDWQRASLEPWRALASYANEAYGNPEIGRAHV